MLTNFLQRISSDLYLSTLAILAGLVFGIFIVYTSPLVVIITLIIFFLTPLLLKAPLVAILGILILNSTILYGNANLGISIGIGHIYVSDILLLPVLFLIGVRFVAEPEFKILHTPLNLPLLLFVGIAFLSTFLAISQSSLTLRMSLGELRTVANYLAFFIVTNFLREEKQLRLLAKSILALATFVAVVVIAQFFIGTELPFLPGRVETLTTQDSTFVGITRVLPPGQSLILVAIVPIIVFLALGGRKQGNGWSLFQVGLIGLAIIISFNRSFWAITGFAILVLAYLTRKRELPRLIGFGLIAIFVTALILFLTSVSSNEFADEFVKATSDRFSTLLTPSTLSESSLQFRKIENQYVLPQIMAHPLLGLGLGANYRPEDTRIRNITGYIHNAHFWIMLKTGLLGYLCFIWLSVAFLVRSFKYWRLILDRQLRAYTLGFALIYTGVLIGAIVNPMFMQSFWTPVFGIMFGFNEAIISKTLTNSQMMIEKQLPTN